ncbi:MULTISPECIES: MarR family winged helix-turn-helix transcriptional regulator [Bacillaceae]|uniref:MarR family winged helix-turn-helix transcriptional regulator n=1 Tax=Bacillaceae TaxID=186817 RepID=UPI0009CA14DB|nr:MULTISPECIES: MarR family transcriptional regulator [Bacillaceae]MCF2646770.1 MarR family transcriptional regulator [Niallia circulans]CAI9389446.1 Transcriptional regulator SlyA [Bacillus sp. T2.9-1]SLL32442.1 MarR family transcriptional regulator [Mycobacteroides abscessus subsp. abscessus]HEO8419941.1 MarR family transcriptional regulator [Yersinia enterocolitica]
MMTEEKNAKEYLENIATIEKDMRYISGIIKQKGREILSNYTMTPPQFVALQWLFEEGDMTIGELSNKMFLAFSTTTDLVDRMEKNQLVQRVKDPNDRRVVRIHMLEEGKRLIDEVIKKRQGYLQEVLNEYTTEDIEELKKNFMRLHQVMREK